MTLRRYFEGGKLDLMTLKNVRAYESGEVFAFKNGDVLNVPNRPKNPSIFSRSWSVKYPDEYELTKECGEKHRSVRNAEDAYLDRVQILRGSVDGSMRARVILLRTQLRIM